jgi:AcrR family transcriptional regulator
MAKSKGSSRRTVGARRRRSPAAARQEILDAAERLFSARSPEAVGLKEVAAEAGVSHSLVSHYFGTYGALVEETLDRGLSSLSRRLSELLTQAGGTGDIVAGLWEAATEPGAARLIAWALLSGRIGAPLKLEGPKEAAAALAARVSSREAADFATLAALSAAYGYAVGRAALLPALGREPSPQADAWFRARLLALLEAALR